MACHTQDEIADEEDVDQKTASNKIEQFRSFGKLAGIPKTQAEHLVDFDPPIYNIWKQQAKSEGSSHFGNSEVRFP